MVLVISCFFLKIEVLSTYFACTWLLLRLGVHDSTVSTCIYIKLACSCAVHSFLSDDARSSYESVVDVFKLSRPVPVLSSLDEGTSILTLLFYLQFYKYTDYVTSAPLESSGKF